MEADIDVVDVVAVVVVVARVDDTAFGCGARELVCTDSFGGTV